MAIMDFPGGTENPILAALASAQQQPTPTPAPVLPAPTSPAGGAIAASGPAPVATPASAAPVSTNPLASLFGTSPSGGSMLGNILMNSGGHLLLPLLGSMLGGQTPAQQAMALKSRQDQAQALGLAGLDDALQQANGNHNKALHLWMKTPYGINYVANGGKMSNVKDYLNTAAPAPGQEIQNYEAILNAAGITGADARQAAYKMKAGVVKVVPQTSTNAEGVTVPTGNYDMVDTSTGAVTHLGQTGGQLVQPQGAGHAALMSPAPQTAGVQPASAAATPATPAPATTPTVPGTTPAPAIMPKSATIAETAGPIGKGVLAGGSFLSNVNPKLFPKETAANTYSIDQIEADASGVLSTYKIGRGSNTLVKPLQDLLTLDKVSSPQEQVAKMIAARQWLEDTKAQDMQTLADPSQQKTKAAQEANDRAAALNKALAHFPPMTTQVYEHPDGTTTTVVGLKQELDNLNNAGSANSPVGKYIQDIPSGLQKEIEGAKGVYNAGMTAIGLPSAPSATPGGATPTPAAPQGPLPNLKPGQSIKYGNAIIKRLN